MYILAITPNLNMQAVPLKNYKGPILKLTKSDKKKIDAVQNNINMYQIEITKLLVKMEKLPICELRDKYEDIINLLEYQIIKGKLYIKEIKMARLNKQKAKLAKEKLDTTI